MTQLHKRFTTAQVKALLDQYAQGHMTRHEIQEVLDVGKTRFFALLTDYHQTGSAFTISYERRSPGHLPPATEEAMRRELRREKILVEDKRLPISGYNYSAVRDRLLDDQIKVSLPTLIERAKQIDCYKPPHKTKPHERQVLTATMGDLIQHDASHHLWSPYASAKWTLITSLDDYSRRLLYADFVPAETSWAHSQAAEHVLRQYGLPLRYYVDSLRVFRFVRIGGTVFGLTATAVVLIIVLLARGHGEINWLEKPSVHGQGDAPDIPGNHELLISANLIRSHAHRHLQQTIYTHEHGGVHVHNELASASA